MISWGDFEYCVASELGRDISEERNPNQNRAISSPPNQSLFIVAGPGSGKTTVIALRILKLIFVDDIDPASILATTFTRKAAGELRSRILGWGDQLKQAFVSHPSYAHIRIQIQMLDLNRIVTGTLDSIAEETLADHRAPGSPPPSVIEDFVSSSLMTRSGLFNHGRYNNNELKSYIITLRGTGWGLNVSEMSKTLCDVKDRFYHDQIDIDRFRVDRNASGINIMCDSINDYIHELQGRYLFDFALLEQQFWERLRDSSLRSFTQNIRFALIDEYQDTNLLQEQIYYEIAKNALANQGSIAVVGDDDQSLYRFRGATVDLFQNFPDRINNFLNVLITTIYLTGNYRSTQVIVDFCNGFIALDESYQNMRVANKPPIIPMRPQPYIDYPILGMFRNTLTQLATDLANFINSVVRGTGFRISDHGMEYTVRINPQLGTAGDIALLLGSQREFDSQNQPRLPLLLRDSLRQLPDPIMVFNPRGQSLESIETVQILCGLMLECIDPNSNMQNNIANLPQVALNRFVEWREEARIYIDSDPQPVNNHDLRQFVDSWQNRRPSGKRTWDREVPMIDLVYKLVTWIPDMQSDIENIVYLEAITRTINQSELFGNFSGQIVFDHNNLERSSFKEALWNIFVPIASGAIEINEDLLETLPTDRVNIMSIHQAKGLEFPLVIVDVGSDFRTNHRAHAFKRFPENGGMTCNMEDELMPYSPLGVPQRRGLDRAFDDLIRQYFVAYSRAKDCLLLVGLEPVRNHIPNVATGWNRNRTWHWGRSLNNLVHI
jgi:DNA helicase-2/ATP-dependent DNA helicase PcrA